MIEKGLYIKYIIKKTNGEPVSNDFIGFVLRLDEFGEPNHVKACRKAILVYANEIENFIPELAKDIKKEYEKSCTK